MLLAWAAPCSAAECEQAATVREVQDALVRAERAFSELDVGAFTVATNAVRQALPCVEEELAPALVAQIHRFEGLRRFADADAARAEQAFTAARALEPDYAFPAVLVPEGNPVRTLYEGIAPEAPRTQAVPRAAEGELRFDGSPGLGRPADQPTLFQHVGVEPMTTAYLWPEEPLPAYAEYREPMKTSTKALIAGAGASAVAAGVLYGLAGRTQATFADPSTPTAELDGLRDRNHRLFVGAGVAGALALGSGVGAAVTGVF